MRRTGVLAVTAGLLVVLAACGTSDSQPSTGASSTTTSSGPDAELLVDVPDGLVVPEGFDTSKGFALRTGLSPIDLSDYRARNSWTLTSFGLASYAADDTGKPTVELTSLTGTSQWRVAVSDPLTPDPNPLLRPSLLSVIGEKTTWLALVERGSEVGGSGSVTRVTTYDAKTGKVAGRTSVPDANRGVSAGGANVVVFLDNGPDHGFGTVVIDPATGKQTQHDPIPGHDDTYAWNDTVVDVYQGKELVQRDCTDIFITGSCPSGARYDGQWLTGYDDDHIAHPGLHVTPGGVTLGYTDMATGKQLPTCTGSTLAIWSPSGRFAVIAGNVIDFRDDSSVCVGPYPAWSAIDDQLVGYGRLKDGEPVRIDAAHGAQTTALPADTMLPLGIGKGGYGIFRTTDAVVVLPPR